MIKCQNIETRLAIVFSFFVWHSGQANISTYEHMVCILFVAMRQFPNHHFVWANVSQNPSDSLIQFKKQI